MERDVVPSSATEARSPSFAARAEAIRPTGVRKMFDLAGADSIHFGLGEPDFQPPEIAIEAFHRAMVDGHNKYTTTAGLPALREAIAAYWAPHRSGLGAGNVCMTLSGTNALLAASLTLLEPGDTILIPEPGFPLYGPHATISGATALSYACTFDNEFVPDVDALEPLVDGRTKALLVCFPSNPTGATITQKQRDGLVDFARRHGLWIITDEVYDRIVYDRPHISFLGGDYDRIVMVNSFSKTFAMTGWRIGYLLSPDLSAMAQLMKIQYYVAACCNDAMQYGVLAALEGAMDYPARMTAAFKQRRDLIVDRLNAIPGVSCHVPHGAFYVFPQVSAGTLTSEQIALEALDDGIVCSPGTAFGPAGEGHLRFAYTTTLERIAEGMDLFEGTMARLRDGDRAGVGAGRETAGGR